jgi:hypothetical protein
LPKKKSRTSRAKSSPKKTFVGPDGKPFFCQVCAKRGKAEPLAYPPPTIMLCLEKPKPVVIATKGKRTATSWTWMRHDLTLCVPCAREVLNDFDPKKISLW